jgi:hypothetical protein
MEMYRFDIGRFSIRAEISPCHDVDLSWDDTGETREKLESGAWEAFDTCVSVRLNGIEIGANYLGQSIYEDPQGFFSEHRDADPMSRNCSVMRAAKGDHVCICHYFPGMVSEAVREARDWLASAKLAA